MVRNPILIFVYYFLYSLVRVLLSIYYRSIKSEGFPKREPRGPLFILSNHPNALMDPLVIVSRFRRPVFFLANASMFRHPFANWFLNTFFCIPVERPKDVGRPLNNADSFRRSREHLESGGSLYIAPEGTCFREYRVRPLKTGTARIALDLLRTGHVDEVSFLMAGINYTDPPSFRSRVMVRFAPILTLRADELTGVEGNWEEVTALTERLQLTMESLVPHTPNEIDSELTRATILFRPATRKKDWFRKLYTLRNMLCEKEDNASAWVNKLHDMLKEKGISSMDSSWLSKVSPWFFLVLLSPMVLWILLHHVIIFGLPEMLRRLSGVDMVYDATVRYMSAFISYPLGILILYWIYKPCMREGPWLWPYLMTILVLGPWSWQMALSLKDLMASIQFRKVMRQNPGWTEQLRLLVEPLTRNAS